MTSNTITNNKNITLEEQYANMNQKMARAVPELASEYAQLPMRSYNKWLSPSGVGPRGEPCFIPGLPDEDEDFITDYVWCKYGPNGMGFYHLLTKPAYTALYSRLQKNPPRRGFLARSPENKQIYDDYMWTKSIVIKRFEASRPDILVGVEAAQVDSQGTNQRRGAYFENRVVPSTAGKAVVA